MAGSSNTGVPVPYVTLQETHHCLLILSPILFQEVPTGNPHWFKCNDLVNFLLAGRWGHLSNTDTFSFPKNSSCIAQPLIKGHLTDMDTFFWPIGVWIRGVPLYNKAEYTWHLQHQYYGEGCALLHHQNHLSCVPPMQNVRTNESAFLASQVHSDGANLTCEPV